MWITDPTRNAAPHNAAPKKLNRGCAANMVQSRWVFALDNSHGAKTHRPTLLLRWSKPDTS